jgi:hypothetical protein
MCREKKWMNQKDHTILSFNSIEYLKKKMSRWYFSFLILSFQTVYLFFDSAFDTMKRRKTRCHSLSSLVFSSMNIPPSFFFIHWCSLSPRWYLYWLLRRREMNINQWKMIYSRFCLIKRENTNGRYRSKKEEKT